LTVSKPVLKAPMVSARETKIRLTAFKFCFAFKFNLRHYTAVPLTVAGALFHHWYGCIPMHGAGPWQILLE
jgi:hypothetical protein